MKFPKKKSTIQSTKDIELSENDFSEQLEEFDSDNEKEETALSTSVAVEEKENFLSRVKSLVPHFEDGTQKKAGANILRFLALMLILTIIARGTAGATLPKVETTTPQNGTITKSVKLSGNVFASDTIDFLAPENLTIKNIPVTVGEKITSGTPIASFSEDEVSEALSRAKIELSTLHQQKKEAGQTKIPGESETSVAQRTLSSAESSYSSAVSARQARENELNDLQARKNQQDQQPPAVASDGTPVFVDGQVTQDQIDQAKIALETAKQDETTKYDSLEDAKRGLQTAKNNDANTKQEEANAAANKKIEMETLTLDIAKQQKVIDALQSIVDNSFNLLASSDGVIVKTLENGTKTDAITGVVSIANSGGNYLAEATVDKDTVKKIAVGNTCQLTKTDSSQQSTDPIPDGKIIAIGDTDPTTETAKVKVSLSGQNWKPNEAIEMDIVQSSQNYQTCIPLAALHQDNNGSFVYRVTQSTTVLGVENIAEKVPVTVLAKNDKTAAIDGAIYSEDLIITSSTKSIEANDKVRLVTS